MKSASQRIGVNPFYGLFCLYLFANLLALITLGFGLPIRVETEEFSFDGAIVAVSALGLFFSLFAGLIVYRAALAMAKPRSDIIFGAGISLLLLFLQLGYLGFNTYYGVNIAGVEDEVQGNALLHLFFWITQPDLLFLILCIGIKSNRWFWSNAVVYTVSLLLRSWIGGLYLVAVVIAIRQYPISISRRNLMFFFIVLLMGVLALPLIVSAKWFFRAGAGFGAALDFLSDVGYSSYLVDCIAYVGNRFQHLGHVALIAQNSQSLNEAYVAGSFIPYWMDGAPQWLYLKLNGIEILQINKHIVRNVLGSSNLAYSTNPGIAGWYFVLQHKAVFFSLYLLAITLIPGIIALKLAGYKYFLLVNSFGLIYLFHGWMGAYFNLVLYMITLILIKHFLARGHRSKQTRKSLGTKSVAVRHFPVQQ